MKIVFASFAIVKIVKIKINQGPIKSKINDASRGAAAQSVTEKPTGCGFDSHSRR